MATTVPGGMYLSADGKTLHDANGNIIMQSEPAPVASRAEIDLTDGVDTDEATLAGKALARRRVETASPRGDGTRAETKRSK